MFHQADIKEPSFSHDLSAPLQDCLKSVTHVWGSHWKYIHVARILCLNTRSCQSQLRLPGWGGGQHPSIQSLHPSITHPSIHPPTHCASDGGPKMESTWSMPPGSSHKEMPWEAQSDVTSSREVPDGWKTLHTILQLGNLSLHHGHFSEFVITSLFLPVSWVQP